ncbi:MAG TPA: hypothetical protein VE994_11395 [Terriglobales bacterium]|nr:hypothetical protein [Terriglobales bacterium]
MREQNPETERQRLSELYAGMSDGELEKIAVEADSLTDVAQQALTAELGRRGLELLRTATLVQEPALQELVTIRQFRDLPDAMLAKGILESAGIECFFGDENIVRMDWFISNLVGGVKLKVKPEDALEANAILEQPIPDNFDVEGVGEYEQPRCPKCESTDISFEELNKPLAYGSAYLGVPIPFQTKAWKCHACGQRWRENAAGEDEPE